MVAYDLASDFSIYIFKIITKNNNNNNKSVATSATVPGGRALHVCTSMTHHAY